MPDRKVKPQADDSQQSPMRRVLANFGLLLRGRGIAGIMKFGSAALMARALGPAEFGILILIQTYALFIRGLFNVQLFDAIVRYGVPLHDAKDKSALYRLIMLCWRLDKKTSIAATLLALLIAPVAGPIMGIEQTHISLLTLYSLTLIATTGNGTATGILRLFDQFDIIGRQMTIGPITLFIGVLACWWLNATFIVFLFVLALSAVIETLYLNWFGWREFKKNIVLADSPHEIKLEEFHGLRHFLWITYWQSNIDLFYKNLSVMAIGSLLGATEAGLLRLARQFSSLIAKPSVLIRQVVFLDLTRSWHQASSDFNLIAFRTAFFSGCAGIFFVALAYFFGDNLLGTLVGREFVAAAPVMTLLVLSATFDLSVSSLRAAAYAAGHAGKVLLINTLTTVVYVIVFFTLIPKIGLIGAGVAALFGAIIPLIAITILIKVT